MSCPLSIHTLQCVDIEFELAIQQQCHRPVAQFKAPLVQIFPIYTFRHAIECLCIQVNASKRGKIVWTRNMESKLIMSTGNFSSAWKTCQTYLDMINHILIATVTIYISFVSYGIGATPRTWHMWLCTIGVSLGYREIRYQ